MRLTFEKFGVWVPDYHISCFAPEKISRQIENDKPFWQRIGRPEVPCLVVMALVPELPRVCNHLGCYIGFGQFVHTMKKINSSIERITHPFFSQRIRGYYRYVG